MLRFLYSTFSCCVLIAPCFAGTPKDDLLAAARSGDVCKLANALAAGADVNSKNGRNETALMLAADAGAFAACRELLWAGADSAAADNRGRTAVEHVVGETDANMPLRLLLRAYAHLQKTAQRSTEKPARPALVMIMEDTVNYLHPKLAAAYQTNTLEEVGITGVDDNKDGFVDNVYGWLPVLNKPYEIRAAQIDAYVKNREAIARIIKIDNDRTTGAITDEEADAKLAEFTNPLSDIMGPMDGLSDGAFLEMIMNAAHGSHVAGIVLDASEGKARFHTLALDFVEESRRMLGPDTERQLEQMHAASVDPKVMLAEFRARLLAHRTAVGRLSSRYIRAMGAGVANLSFGGGIGFWCQFAQRHILQCLQDHLSKDPTVTLGEDIHVMSNRIGLELYSAAAAMLSVVFYENPDVLFVIAAGNDGLENDQSYTSPAYLSRFFPNVITVASTDADGEMSSFSNFGALSVNIGAPGEKILSTVIPEASVHMNGTSMAAPHVAGVAALIRTIAPNVTAAELRRLIDYTARDVEELRGWISAEGVIDKEMLRGVFTGNARERSNAQARIAANSAVLADDVYPRHAADADRASLKALELDKANPEAWRARAVTLSAAGDQKKALEHVDRALALDSDSEPAWMVRAEIQSKMRNILGLFESIGKAIAALEAQGSAADFLRARRLVLRADLHLQVGNTDAARADVRKARELNPWVRMSGELEALL